MRVLRLLWCEGAPSQEACQRLVQPLAAFGVRVDVVDEQEPAYRSGGLFRRFLAEWKGAC
jgi:hypothetical protein